MSTRTAVTPFTEAEQSALATLARLIIPPSTMYRLPGADDPQILAAIQADAAPHHAALAGALSGYLRTGAVTHEGRARAFREGYPEAARLLQTLVVQCYYRDDRVMRSLSIELRPPFPAGYAVEQGDWSLLEPVRSGPARYRETG